MLSDPLCAGWSQPSLYNTLAPASFAQGSGTNPRLNSNLRNIDLTIGPPLLRYMFKIFIMKHVQSASGWNVFLLKKCLHDIQLQHSNYLLP